MSGAAPCNGSEVQRHGQITAGSRCVLVCLSARVRAVSQSYFHSKKCHGSNKPFYSRHGPVGFPSGSYCKQIYLYPRSNHMVMSKKQTFPEISIHTSTLHRRMLWEEMVHVALFTPLCISAHLWCTLMRIGVFTATHDLFPSLIPFIYIYVTGKHWNNPLSSHITAAAFL